MSVPHEDEVEKWLRARTSSQVPELGRYELLDGEQVVMPAHTERHASCVNELTRLLHEKVGQQATVSVQSPVALAEGSEPCPDLALLRPRDDGYKTSYAAPSDVYLLIEVSDTPITLTTDRGRKASLYAKHGITECWVVDLTGNQVLVHRSPASGGYRDIRNLRGAAELSIEHLDGIVLAAADVVGV